MHDSVAARRGTIECSGGRVPRRSCSTSRPCAGGTRSFCEGEIMNVAILCGGYGTRLAGLWDGPKCLVPLGDGGPIIAHLIRRARVEALAKCTYGLVGHK